ncbi:MAG: lipopolysaccharide biosynthesis protein [Bacillota bacterium]
MQNDKESFNRVALLSGARFLGMAFSFAIPMYLSRHLSVETYGTYKLVTLIYWFAQVALNLGLDDSVNYYLRWDRKNFALYSWNALLSNFVITGIVALGLTIFRLPIAKLLNDLDLANYLPLLGVLIVVTICSQQMEGLLINFNRFKERLYLDAGTEFLKSAALLGAFILFDSITWALGFLSVLMTLRLIWVVYTIEGHKNNDGLKYRDGCKFIPTQIKYGLPLGFSRIITNLLNVENFVISSFYNITQFTIYSVGSFENPLINSLRSSVYELIIIQLIEEVRNGNFQKAEDTWRRMSRKLLLVIIPFSIYTAFFSKELITFIYSNKYAESAPYLTVFSLYIFIGCLNPEPLFRAASQTAYALKIKIVGVILGVALIFAGAYWISPMGVLWAKIIAVGAMNLFGLVVGARMINSNFFRLFMWSDLIKLSALSTIFSAILKYCFQDFNWLPFWILATSFTIFTILLFVASIFTHLLKPDEIGHLRYLWLKLMGKFKIGKKLQVPLDSEG